MNAHAPSSILENDAGMSEEKSATDDDRAHVEHMTLLAGERHRLKYADASIRSYVRFRAMAIAERKDGVGCIGVYRIDLEEGSVCELVHVRRSRGGAGDNRQCACGYQAVRRQD